MSRAAREGKYAGKAWGKYVRVHPKFARLEKGYGLRGWIARVSLYLKENKPILHEREEE